MTLVLLRLDCLTRSDLIFIVVEEVLPEIIAEDYR